MCFEHCKDSYVGLFFNIDIRRAHIPQPLDNKSKKDEKYKFISIEKWAIFYLSFGFSFEKKARDFFLSILIGRLKWYNLFTLGSEQKISKKTKNEEKINSLKHERKKMTFILFKSNCKVKWSLHFEIDFNSK